MIRKVCPILLMILTIDLPPAHAQKKPKSKPAHISEAVMILLEEDKGWYYVAESVSDYVFVKKDTIKQFEDGTVKLWVKYKPKNVTNWREGRPAPKGLDYLLDYEQLDCARKLSGVLQLVLYDKQGIVIKSQLGSRRWEEIIPESVDELIFDYVCHEKK
jgi:hypothetical protein